MTIEEVISQRHQKSMRDADNWSIVFFFFWVLKGNQSRLIMLECKLMFKFLIFQTQAALVMLFDSHAVLIMLLISWIESQCEYCKVVDLYFWEMGVMRITIISKN